VELQGLRICGGDRSLQPCLTSPGMGDQNASLVAQAYNQHLMVCEGAVDESYWMSYGYPPPVGHLWVGSYIDDILALMISRADSLGRHLDDLDSSRIAAVRRAHQKAGAKLHDAKRQERLSCATIWGAHIDGVLARVRGEPQVAHQLVRVTAAALRAGQLTPHLVTRLVSSWMHHMMLARASLYVFQEVYEFGHRLPRHRVARLTGGVIDQLLGAATLAPLYEADCRAPLHPQVFASDATETSAAVVMAEPTELELAWLWLRIPRRGSYARLYLDDVE
jgi:hypothetical protein